MPTVTERSDAVVDTNPQWQDGATGLGRIFIGVAVVLGALWVGLFGLFSIGRAALEVEESLRIEETLRLDDRLDPGLDLERDFVLWDSTHGPHVKIVVNGTDGDVRTVVGVVEDHVRAEGFSRVTGDDQFARNRDDSLDADWIIVRATDSDPDTVEIIHTVFDTDTVAVYPVLGPFAVILLFAGLIIAKQGFMRRRGLDSRPPASLNPEA